MHLKHKLFYITIGTILLAGFKLAA